MPKIYNFGDLLVVSLFVVVVAAAAAAAFVQGNCLTVKTQKQTKQLLDIQWHFFDAVQNQHENSGV